MTTPWSAYCECDAATRNWVRARQYVTKGRAVECVYGCDRIWMFDRANYLTVLSTLSTAGRELIECDMPVFESLSYVLQ